MNQYPAILLLLLAGLATASGGAGPSETKTFPARLGDMVVVQNGYGRVKVRGTSTSQATPPQRPVPQQNRGTCAPRPQPAGNGDADTIPSHCESVRPVHLRGNRQQPERKDEPTRKAPQSQQEHQTVEGGQPLVSQAQERNPTYKVAVNWVFLNVSVRDRVSNRSLSELRQEDFLVYEDGVLQNVGHFETTGVLFSLLLLLDVSGSTESYLHLIKSASIDFTHQIKENDRIAIAAFNTSVRLAQDFTGDRPLVSRAIDSISSGGGTAFYDALDVGVREYLRDVEGRKAIVVFTDGVDNRLDVGDGSQISFARLYANIEEVDTIIYPIFLDTERGPGITTAPGSRSRPSQGRGGGPTAHDRAREQLQMIADQTGGRMYSPRRVADLRGVYSEIADELRIQYRLGYSPTNKTPDGSWRAIRVKIRNNPDAVARTRKGYFARQGGTQTAPSRPSPPAGHE